MSRFNYAATTSASQLPQVYYRNLVDVGVTSSTVYCCTGFQYLYAMGNTYSPVGHLGQIEPIQEENNTTAHTVRCTLQAVGSMDLVEAMKEDMFGRPLKIYHVFLSGSLTMVSTPEAIWNGLINKVSLNFGSADKGTFLEVEADTDLRRQPPVSSYNRETMLLVSSGDTFCNFVDQIPLSKAYWGGASPVDLNKRRTPHRPYHG